ncbi:MAG: tetratricopeptide repeat protein [bacterium]|nr:tetratricopeptide repeat protein [bacterium]
MKKRLLSIVGLIVMVSIILVPMAGCGKKNKQSNYPGRLNTNSPEYMVNEAIFLIRSGDLDKAEKKLLKALKQKPKLLMGLNGLGIVYLNKRDFHKAATYFNKVIKIDPRFYDAYNHLGVIYTELGNYDLAKENLLAAANAEAYRTPENAFANLAMLEISKGKWESALRYVDKGIRENTRFPPLSNLKGVIMENQKKYKEAVMWYRRALSFLKEPDSTYLINMARVYSTVGKKNKALDLLEKALSSAFTPQLKGEIRKMIADVEKK